MNVRRRRNETRRTTTGDCRCGLPVVQSQEPVTKDRPAAGSLPGWTKIPGGAVAIWRWG